MLDEIIAHRKVVFFTSCYFNYYDPEVSKATYRVLRRNKIELTVPDQVCCGLPMMGKGNFKGAIRNIKRNIRSLAAYVKEGYVVITPCPSCHLMIKRDYPLLIKDENADLVSCNILQLSEYIMELESIGLLKKDLQEIPQTVFYHTPCHMRVQDLGKVSIAMMELIPKLTVKKVSEVCCGLGGAYGFEKSNYLHSKEIARRLASLIEENPTDRLVTDCGGCGLQMTTLSGRKVDHPICLLDEACQC